MDLVAPVWLRLEVYVEGLGAVLPVVTGHQHAAVPAFSIPVDAVVRYPSRRGRAVLTDTWLLGAHCEVTEAEHAHVGANRSWRLRRNLGGVVIAASS